ncbi:EMB2076, partial [Symbiodinium sp. KB8]
NIIEDLRQISKASCPAQRGPLTSMVVKQLWLQGLPWRGTYDDGHGGQITIHVKADTALLQYRQRHGPSKVLKARIEDDTLLVDNKHGRFDGRQIRWGAEESWSRLDEPGEEDAFHKSVAMVRLIMPQLAAALRWELESSSPREAEQVDLEAQSEASAGRPLFNFLLGYASATKQPEVVSELYWALVCLCHQPNGGEALKAARIALLDALQAGDDHFLQDCRRRVGGQCEVWRQHTALIQYHNKQSSSGGGNFHHRTTKLREVLRRWSVLRRALDLESFDLAAADAAILASPRSRPNHRAPAVGIDLVDPDTEMDHLFLSLPVDPSVRFEGTVVEKSAVLASKQAPLMLVCRTRHNQLHGSLAHSPATSPSRSNQAAGRHGEQVLEKYLLKVGDDLRQDQLVIQLMDERTSGSEMMELHPAAQALLESGHLETLPEYSDILAAVGARRCWEAGLDVWSRLVRSPRRLRPDVKALNTALRVLGNAAQWEHALALLASAAASGVQPNVESLHHTLTALGEGNQWQAALSRLWAESEFNVPDVSCYGAAIKALSSSGEHHQTLWLLHDVETVQLRPDTQAYAAAILSCAELGEWQRALAFLDYMPQDSSLTRPVKAFGLSLEVCKATGNWERALLIFEEFIGKGGILEEDLVEPLLKTCLASKQQERVREFLIEWDKLGFLPSYSLSRYVADNS